MSHPVGEKSSHSPYAAGAMMLNKDSEVPFGPFLIASMAIVFIFAEKFSNLIAFLF